MLQGHVHQYRVVVWWQKWASKTNNARAWYCTAEYDIFIYIYCLILIIYNILLVFICYCYIIWWIKCAITACELCCCISSVHLEALVTKSPCGHDMFFPLLLRLSRADAGAYGAYRSCQVCQAYKAVTSVMLGRIGPLQSQLPRRRRVLALAIESPIRTQT